MARLIDDGYGKQRVRVTKVVRDGEVHSVYELSVDVTLRGEFERVYTDGDNSPCVPTDTMKNTVYALAKTTDFDGPEQFALTLSAHFVGNFEHVTSAEVAIAQVRWARIVVDGREHEHSFYRQPGMRTAHVVRENDEPPTVSGGIEGLQVLKSSGSGFSGFLKDEYTTLPETDDRILATTVDATWTYASQDIPFNEAFETANQRIADVFATHQSPSLQSTLYAIGERVLEDVPSIEKIHLSMPNQHHLWVDLSPFGLDNDDVVFKATDEPYGLIEGTVGRSA